MQNLSELYQQLIIDHSQRPHNFCRLDPADYVQDGYNPLCGDKITLYLREQNGVISQVGFQGSGCAISIASASLMSEAIKNKTPAEALTLFSRFQKLVTSGDVLSVDQLGKLVVFAGVAEFPMRIKCATLAWHALKAALTEKTKMVSTE